MEKGVHKLWRVSSKAGYMTKPNAAIDLRCPSQQDKKSNCPKLLSSILTECTMNQHPKKKKNPFYKDLINGALLSLSEIKVSLKLEILYFGNLAT